LGRKRGQARAKNITTKIIAAVQGRLDGYDKYGHTVSLVGQDSSGFQTKKKNGISAAINSMRRNLHAKR